MHINKLEIKLIIKYQTGIERILIDLQILLKI